MSPHAASYLKHLTQKVQRRIDAELSAERAPAIAKDTIAFHFTDAGSLKFHKYYVQIVGNERGFLTKDGFFKTFKTMYSLQGLDNTYLSRLEDAKKGILIDLKADELARLYITHFAQVSIKYGDGERLKDLGSFFSKLTHTFRPSDYCALDNPVKNFFGLKNEGFYISFIAISSAYNGWIQENSLLVTELRQQIKASSVV